MKNCFFLKPRKNRIIKQDQLLEPLIDKNPQVVSGVKLLQQKIINPTILSMISKR